MPEPVLGELYYGAYRSARPEKHLAQIALFLQAVDVLLTDQETCRLSGQIASTLAQAGTPIPQNDIWIAALAWQTGLSLVTSDSHFDLIPGMKVLRW